MPQHKDMSHSQFKVALDTLTTKADGKHADYGLTEEIVDLLKAGSQQLGADIDNQATKAAESKAATTKLTATRKNGNELFAKAKRMAKNSGVAASKLAEIGFDEDDKIKSKVAVFDPLDLVVTGASNGTNTTKWNKNGNKPGTIFNVEAMIGEATDFIIVGNTNGNKFEHKNQKPGTKAVYRVRAQRGEDFSDYSNEASVY